MKKTNKWSPAGWRETRGLPGNNSELLVRSEESPDHNHDDNDDDDDDDDDTDDDEDEYNY